MLPLFGETLDNFDGNSVTMTWAPEIRPNDPWGKVLLENWVIVSVAHWPLYQFRCILSREGDVKIYGAGGNPKRFFQLPGAGVFNKQSIGLGYVNRIRAVGNGLYVCGQSRQVYRLEWDGKHLDRARWVDMAGSMRQPPISEPPDDDDDLDAWMDANDRINFTDIAGCAENDIYCAGDETWHWNGQAWRQLTLPTDEPIHAIKIIDRNDVILVGHNGTVLRGNARQGFADLSSVDDNQNFSSVEFFEGRFWLASNMGLFTLDKAGGAITAYQTSLTPNLQDTHTLEAMDGVLWSFGNKDLAYFDSTVQPLRWVRVHHPDNPPIGGVGSAQVAASTQALVTQVNQPLASVLPAWLPPSSTSAGKLDIGGLIARVGHSGVGTFIAEQLAPFGLQAKQVLQVQKLQRYEVTVPKQGVTLVLQYVGPEPAPKEAHLQPERWGLAEVRLRTRNADPKDHWQGPWPGGIDPYASNLRDQADKVWGEAEAENASAISYFVDGSQGAAWVVSLQLSQARRLNALRVLHLGGYLPWNPE